MAQGSGERVNGGEWAMVNGEWAVAVDTAVAVRLRRCNRKGNDKDKKIGNGQ